MNEKVQPLIKINNEKGENLLTLDSNGKITWKDDHPCCERDFKSIVVYMFDLVFRHQAQLFQTEQKIIELLEGKKDEPQIIKLPH